MPKYSIYALIDPRTDQERYIGVTKDEIGRLYFHMRNAPWLETPKDAWLLELVPELRVLETVEASHHTETVARERELYWIQRFKSSGASLLNISGLLPHRTPYQPRPCALTEYRARLFWSVSELAQKANIDVSSVKRAERGLRISGRVARQIAEALSEGLGRTIAVQDIEGLDVHW
jgi:hypothetical protein